MLTTKTNSETQSKIGKILNTAGIGGIFLGLSKDYKTYTFLEMNVQKVSGSIINGIK